MLRVTSRSNPKLKETARLVASSRDRRKAGKCVLEGEHLIAAYAARYGAPETLLIGDSFLRRPEAKALAERFDSRAISVPDELLEDFAVLPAGVGMLAVVATPRSPANVEGDFLLLLDDVQDPGNVGSMLRSAAAAGVSDALLSPQCAFAWSPKVLRAGMGGHFKLAMRQVSELADAVESFAGSTLCTVSSAGKALPEVAFEGRLGWIFGAEGQGVTHTLAARARERVRIPMQPGNESLNVAAAAAICLYEAFTRKK